MARKIAAKADPPPPDAPECDPPHAGPGPASTSAPFAPARHVYRLVARFPCPFADGHEVERYGKTAYSTLDGANRRIGLFTNTLRRAFKVGDDYPVVVTIEETAVVD